MLDISHIFEPIQADLALVEARLQQPPPHEYEVLTAITKHLFSSGGKRIRPALVLLTGRLTAARHDQVITLATAVEMLHTATLVHDDLIDGALLRRGIPTLNAQWTPAATILAGDYLFARAAELAAQTQHVQAMSIFAQTLMIICSGELRQQFSKSTGSYSRPDYYQRIEAKTAALFRCATEAAGVLSNAPEEQIEALRAYGYNLGVAFQIVDDILDFESDPATLGKPVGSDLAQGLVTLPALYYLESHPADNLVSAALNNHSNQPDLIARAVDAIRQSGATRAALAEAGDFVRRSQAALAYWPQGANSQPLYDLAQYVVQRQM